MKQLDLFYDRLPQYIVIKQTGNDRLWVIWDNFELKETNYIFTTGEKARQCLNTNLTQQYRYA
jgi:hypothetical protein